MKGFSKLGLTGLLFLYALLATQTYAYDIVKRTKLIDDKFKTQEMLRPYGHDFILEPLNVAITPDTLDMLKDFKKISDKPAGTSETEIISTANDVLPKYYNKENILRARVVLGFPIFSFNAFGLRWQPNFRADAGATVVLTPTEGTFSFTETVSTLESSGLDPTIAAALKNCNYNAIAEGAVVIDACVTQGAITPAQKTAINAQFPNVATFKKDSTQFSSTTPIPVANVYAKFDGKVGFPVTFTKDEHFFGEFFVGALGRLDLDKSCNAIAISFKACKIDMNQKNTVWNTILDAKVGYKNSNYTVSAAVEELKLAETSKTESSTPMKYGSDPLFRIHAQADYRLWIFSAQPYVGTHARSGYGFGDAYYAGADWGAHVWGDRLGTTLRTMADKEHFTIGPRFKLWLMQLELMAQLPMKKEIDGVKISKIYSGDLRFFF